MVPKATKGAEPIAAKGIDCKNIRLVTTDTGPVIYVENSSDLRFDTIGYNKGTALPLSVNGDKCGGIRLSGTDASKTARKAAFNYGASENVLEIKQ